MKDLEGRVAVVTGAASGIGAGLVRAFAQERMRLVLADIELEPAAQLADELSGAGARAIAVRTDLAWLREAEVPVSLELHPAPADAGPPSPLLRLPGLVLGVTAEPKLAWRLEPGSGGSARVGAVIAPGAAPEGVELRLAVEEGP